MAGGGRGVAQPAAEAAKRLKVGAEVGPPGRHHVRLIDDELPDPPCRRGIGEDVAKRAEERLGRGKDDALPALTDAREHLDRHLVVAAAVPGEGLLGVGRILAT